MYHGNQACRPPCRPPRLHTLTLSYQPSLTPLSTKYTRDTGSVQIRTPLLPHGGIESQRRTPLPPLQPSPAPHYPSGVCGDMRTNNTTPCHTTNKTAMPRTRVERQSAVVAAAGLLLSCSNSTDHTRQGTHSSKPQMLHVCGAATRSKQ